MNPIAGFFGVVGVIALVVAGLTLFLVVLSLFMKYIAFPIFNFFDL